MVGNGNGNGDEIDELMPAQDRPEERIQKAAAAGNLSRLPWRHDVTSHYIFADISNFSDFELKVVQRSIDTLGIGDILDVPKTKDEKIIEVAGQPDLEKLSKQGVTFPGSELYSPRRGQGR